MRRAWWAAGVVTAAALLIGVPAGDTLAAVRKGPCYSAKDCTGKVLYKSQHAHNCHGKSWRSPVTGQCTNQVGG